MEKGNFCISTMISSNTAVLFTVSAITILVIRIFYVLYRSSKPIHSKSPRFLSTLIVLGSGGHTAEMLNLLYVLQMERFKPRYYIAAATDNMSLQKAHVFEDSLLGKVRRNADSLPVGYIIAHAYATPQNSAPPLTDHDILFLILSILIGLLRILGSTLGSRGS